MLIWWLPNSAVHSAGRHAAIFILVSGSSPPPGFRFLPPGITVRPPPRHPVSLSKLSGAEVKKGHHGVSGSQMCSKSLSKSGCQTIAYRIGISAFSKASLNLRRAVAQLCETRKHIEYNSITPITHEGEDAPGFCAHALNNPSPCHGASPMQANFHIVLSEIERRGGLCRTHTFDVPQHDHRAVLFRKPEQRLFQQVREFCSGRILLRIRRTVDHVVHRTFSITPSVVKLLVAVTQT